MLHQVVIVPMRQFNVLEMGRRYVLHRKLVVGVIATANLNSVMGIKVVLKLRRNVKSVNHEHVRKANVAMKLQMKLGKNKVLVGRNAMKWDNARNERDHLLHAAVHQKLLKMWWNNK